MGLCPEGETRALPGIRPDLTRGRPMNTDKTYAEQIAAEYAPKDTSKVVALRKLDRRAKAPANIAAYTIGVGSCLVFGTGMCLSMGVIGGGGTLMFVMGIVVGVLGMVGMGVNYPIYKRLLEQGKQKYAADIIRLASQISE